MNCYPAVIFVLLSHVVLQVRLGRHSELLVRVKYKCKWFELVKVVVTVFYVVNVISHYAVHTPTDGLHCF